MRWIADQPKQRFCNLAPIIQQSCISTLTIQSTQIDYMDVQLQNNDELSLKCSTSSKGWKDKNAILSYLEQIIPLETSLSWPFSWCNLPQCYLWNCGYFWIKQRGRKLIRRLGCHLVSHFATLLTFQLWFRWPFSDKQPPSAAWWRFYIHTLLGKSFWTTAF